jgi:hypothetical protein
MAGVTRGATLTACTALALIAAGAGCSAAPPAAKGSHMDAQARLKACEATSATLNLVDEALLTRTAITPATIDSVAPPVTIPAGDARLAKLTAALRGVALEPAKLPRFELKLRVTVHCADGGMLTLLGSPTGKDGRLDLSIDGEALSTHTPLRRELEALAK